MVDTTDTEKVYQRVANSVVMQADDTVDQKVGLQDERTGIKRVVPLAVMKVELMVYELVVAMAGKMEFRLVY